MSSRVDCFHWTAVVDDAEGAPDVPARARQTPGLRASRRALDVVSREQTMTANIQFDHETRVAERRSAYESEVIAALLDETVEERDERIALLQVAQELVQRAFEQANECCEW